MRARGGSRAAALAGLAFALVAMSRANASISRVADSLPSASRESLSRVAERWRELGDRLDVRSTLPERVDDRVHWQTDALLMARHELAADAPLVIAAVSIGSSEADGATPRALGRQVTIAFLSRDDGRDYEVVPLPGGVTRLEHLEAALAAGGSKLAHPLDPTQSSHVWRSRSLAPKLLPQGVWLVPSISRKSGFVDFSLIIALAARTLDEARSLWGLEMTPATTVFAMGSDGYTKKFSTVRRVLLVHAVPTLAWSPALGEHNLARFVNVETSGGILERAQRIPPTAAGVAASDGHKLALARTRVATAVVNQACAAVLHAQGLHAGSCADVSAPALVAELSAGRASYFALENSLRQEMGLAPAPAECAGAALPWGEAKPPRPIAPMRSRPSIGAALEEEGCLRVGLEVGSYTGANAQTLLARWPSAWLLVMVDPWTDQGDAHYEDILAGSQERMDSVMLLALLATEQHGVRCKAWRAFSTQAGSQAGNGTLDFVYLDARHDYTSVTEDLTSWWPTLRPGAVFSGHDFLDAGTRDDGNQWEVQPDGTVRADMRAVRGAVEDFARQVDRDVTVTSGLDGYPSWLLRK